MQNTFEEVRRQIHEIRNIVGPIDLKISDIEHRMAAIKAYVEEGMGQIESKVLSNLFRLDKHDVAIAELMERIKYLEQKLLKQPN